MRIRRLEETNFEYALETPEAIADFLKEEVHACSFSEVMGQVYQGGRPLNQQLVEKFLEYEGEENREAVARKVRNWLSDKNLPGNREELFKVCFAIGADEAEAEIILGMMAENGIHYRNPRELVYAFCLRTGEDYPEARRMFGELWGEDFPEKTLEYQVKMRSAEDKRKLTYSIRNEFIHLRTKEELNAFFEERKEEFGIHHNTAYRKFSKMLEQLLFPESEYGCLPGERHYSIEKVVENYLRLNMPYNKKTGQYTKLQKEIKKNWPTAKVIQEMYNRKMDVNRKTLLLLYLATEGMESREENCFSDYSVEEHCVRIDMMLTECGMSRLNPHNPFDYLVLQALQSGETDEFMSDRIARIIERLYGQES